MPGRPRGMITVSRIWVVVGVWVWVRDVGRAGRKWNWEWEDQDQQFCDHLPCSFLYFDVCFWFFYGNPPTQGAADTPPILLGQVIFYP